MSAHAQFIKLTQRSKLIRWILYIYFFFLSCVCANVSWCKRFTTQYKYYIHNYETVMGRTKNRLLLVERLMYELCVCVCALCDMSWYIRLIWQEPMDFFYIPSNMDGCCCRLYAIEKNVFCALACEYITIMCKAALRLLLPPSTLSPSPRSLCWTLKTRNNSLCARLMCRPQNKQLNKWQRREREKNTKNREKRKHKYTLNHNIREQLTDSCWNYVLKIILKPFPLRSDETRSSGILSLSSCLMPPIYALDDPNWQSNGCRVQQRH